MPGRMEDLYALLTSVAWKSFLLLALAWLFSIALRRRAAASRRLVWAGAFVALLALPFLSSTLPPVGMPTAAALARGIDFVVDATARAGNPPAASMGAGEIGGAPAGALARADWRPWVIAAWSAGVFFGLAHLLFGWIMAWRLRRTAVPYQAGAIAATEGVDVLLSARGSMPMTLGIFRPAILLPAAAREWPPARLRMVLLHELAHVRRSDVAIQLLARVALALYWWNPLAWRAWREFLKEREQAADDMVLIAGERPSEYAGHLLDIASTTHAPAALISAAAMARASQLEGRVTAILDDRRKRHRAGRAPALAAALVGLAMAAPVAVLRAQESAAAPLPADVNATIEAARAQKNYRMLDDAAASAESHWQYDLARKLLDASLAIRGETSGMQSAEYGVGLLNLGRLEQRRNRLAEAGALYKQAAALLEGRDAAEALTRLGVVALISKDYGSALEYLNRARGADAAHAAEALMWTAVALERQDKPAEAEASYRNALALEPLNAAGAATIRELLANLLARQNRETEARLLREQAAEIRRSVSPAPAPAESTGGKRALRIGGAVSAPQLITKLEPQYTEEARVAQYQGTVVLSVEIGPDGVPRNMSVVRGLGLGLEEKAKEAIAQWRFKPGMKDGQPVTVAAQIEVNFRLL